MDIKRVAEASIDAYVNQLSTDVDYKAKTKAIEVIVNSFELAEILNRDNPNNVFNKSYCIQDKGQTISLTKEKRDELVENGVIYSCGARHVDIPENMEVYHYRKLPI